MLLRPGLLPLWPDCRPTLNPPILWSFLNSFPFLYQRRVGTGFPVAWHRNLTVLLAGTAWSCFSIFSGITHWGAMATEEKSEQKIDVNPPSIQKTESRCPTLTLTQLFVAGGQLIGEFSLFLWWWFIIFLIFRGFYYINWEQKNNKLSCLLSKCQTIKTVCKYWFIGHRKSGGSHNLCFCSAE